MNMSESELVSTDAVNADESNVTDIELMPDGRIFVFGTSRQVLEVLSELQTTGNGEILARLRSCGQETPDTVSKPGSSP
jgi:hypothetical protein